MFLNAVSRTFRNFKEFWSFSIFWTLSWIIWSTSPAFFCLQYMSEEQNHNIVKLFLGMRYHLKWFKWCTHRFILKFIHTEKLWFSSHTCLPVVFGDFRQYAVHTDTWSGAKGPPTERTLFCPAAAPVRAQTHFAEAVAAGCCHRAAEHVLAQRAQEVLLGQETHARFHPWKITTILNCKSHLIIKTVIKNWFPLLTLERIPRVFSDLGRPSLPIHFLKLDINLAFLNQFIINNITRKKIQL